MDDHRLLLFLFYLLAAFLQTVVPLPADPAGYCAEQSYASTPQLRPFYFVDVLQTRATVSGTWSTTLNIVLLAPLGFFLRHLSGVRFLTAATLGFTTSLFFELTQLTGAKLQIVTRAFPGSWPRHLRARPFGAVAGRV